MSFLPVEASELSDFTPPSLANMPAPPVFQFRPSTERDTRQFWRRCAVMGLVLHSKDAMRATIKTELARLWDDEAFNHRMPMLQAFWDAADYNEQVGESDQVEIDPADARAVSELLGRVMEASQELRQMAVENDTFMDDAPKMAISHFLVGWRNFSSPLRREAGSIPLACIDDMERQLRAVEEESLASGIQGVTPGLAFTELALNAFGLLTLSQREMGNSASPAASGKTPSSLSQARRPRPMKVGTSQKSARSKKTQAAG